ncbi:HesA/MoeB/ThiF family protein [Teredinibacter haidensis]|uniref:HesA/MoeB/ThiF family protein n=1 Tax=Teredinibacter haidensis TaxID=2731755 RepID=UPI000948D7A3|nr:molybdopterin-synthase adenylyltransferase MoeB [Teredinibacter haidensis]
MNDQQLLRYSRHILLPQLEVEGQEKIMASRVLIIGLGGLGSPVVMYLAASGVGELVVVDDDVVDESNLQRQIIHTEKYVGSTKAASAENGIKKLNSAVSVTAFDKRLSRQELLYQVGLATVVVDCCDNFATRKQVNEACYKLQTPLVSGAAIRLEGQLTVFDFRSKESPCYECLYQLTGDEDLSCSQNGVLSPVVGIVGCSQSLEVLKLVADFGKPLVGQLGLFDGSANQWRYLTIAKDTGCNCCGR